MADGYISKITLPSGNTYDIKDAVARDSIANIQASVTSGIHYIGESQSAITNGSTVKTITVDNNEYTAKPGDLVIYGQLEFIWGADDKWHEFGSTGSLKGLAFKDSASGSYTPTGNVSQPTFTGTAATGLTVSPASSGAATYTPAGTVSQPTFTGTAATISSSYTPAGNVTVKAGSSSSYTPAGTVSQPTFSGTAATIAVSGGTGTATYTPAGSVSKPNIAVTPSTTTVNSITDIGTLPTLTTTVSGDGNLTIGFHPGTTPKMGSNTTVMTGVSAALADAPTFTGTGTRLTASYTPAGTVTQPSFTGTQVALSGTFSGTEGTATASYTPAGGVSQPTFTGTGKRLVLQDYTPAGTVSKPTFTGTAATVTVS